ncbi:MAG: alanyl-tRNA synthetase [Phycisphaerales bacterium]
MPQTTLEMQTVQPNDAKQPAWIARWGKRAGVIAFLFFLIKGLAWLLVPVALATWWAQ